MPQKLQNITNTDFLINEDRTDFEKTREILRSYPVPLTECARMMCSFLFAAFASCLQRSFFVCNVRFLFAAFVFCLQRFFYLQFSFFYLQRFFFVCSVSFLFAAFLFCLQHVPCGPSYSNDIHFPECTTRKPLFHDPYDSCGSYRRG